MITLLQLRPYTGDAVAPSPNHGIRKAQAIEGIVLHATGDAGNEARALSWMRSPKSRVSCHLLVSRAGRTTRLVGDQHRAWHAGVSRWKGKSDVNSITLGIEIANRNDGEPFTDAQYARVAEIVAHYCRQGLSLADVVGHGEIAPGRKTDPVGWDWSRFRALVQERLRQVEVPIPTAPSAQLPEPLAEMLSVAPATAPQAAAPPPEQGPMIALPKYFLRSRTFWVNGLTVAVAAGAIIAGDALDVVLGVRFTVPEDIAKWVILFVGLANVVLRFLTTQPIGSRSSAQSSQP